MTRALLCWAFASLNRSDSPQPTRLVFADGSSRDVITGEAPIVITFKNPKAERHTILMQSIGFIESYRTGDIVIGGPHGETEALRMFLRMYYALPQKPGSWNLNPIAAILKWWQELTLDNHSYAQEKANLYAHYNAPAEFFHYMCGELYGYTEGYYETGYESQNEAQFKKYEYICRKLRLREGLSVVEVGSAWGTMALMMARRYGAHVVNYGLVEEQNRVMMERVRRIGLEDRISIVRRDCRELGHEKGKYDRYVSLGVLEHAGRREVEEWIRNISLALKPGGIGVITNVGYYGRYLTDYIIGKYIWRGCYFPAMGDILRYFEKYDLHLVDLEDTHFLYADTMEVMLSKMLEHWDAISAVNPEIFDEKFRRIWMLYYLGSIEAFRSARSPLQTFQYTFVKGRSDSYPHTRGFLYAEPFDTSDMHEYEVPLGQDGFPEHRDAQRHVSPLRLPYEGDKGEAKPAFFRE